MALSVLFLAATLYFSHKCVVDIPLGDCARKSFSGRGFGRNPTFLYSGCEALSCTLSIVELIPQRS